MGQCATFFKAMSVAPTFFVKLLDSSRSARGMGDASTNLHRHSKVVLLFRRKVLSLARIKHHAHTTTQFISFLEPFSKQDAGGQKEEGLTMK